MVIAGCLASRPENPKRPVHPEAMELLEASRAAKRKMELDALWSHLEFLQSAGLAAEDAKPSDQKAKETPVEEVAAEHPPPPPAEQAPYRVRRDNVAKQSGAPGVNWCRTAMACKVTFPKLDSKRKAVYRTHQCFALKKFMGPGITEAQADAAALEAAFAFRAELVKKGTSASQILAILMILSDLDLG
jgi:hypothetical protein